MGITYPGGGMATVIGVRKGNHYRLCVCLNYGEGMPVGGEATLFLRSLSYLLNFVNGIAAGLPFSRAGRYS